jgi:SAM-dependent methyltransferase
VKKTKRTKDLKPSEVQAGNQEWWSSNPMTYDWHGEIASQQFSLEWFDEIDRRFVRGARLFATNLQPFDRILPFSTLKGRDVLEIGCGMGLHTELMARAGARVTAIDIASTSVAATSARLALKGLSAVVKEADAEQLPFPDASFDFLWSWGVVHHSSRTVRVIREIARVLRPNGEARVMVYNRLGMAAKLIYWKEHIIQGRFLRHSFEETLYDSSDGFSARFYIQEQCEDIFRGFFADVDSYICGQEADAIPLPRHLRRLVIPLVSNRMLVRLQAQRGGFIFVTARNPD